MNQKDNFGKRYINIGENYYFFNNMYNGSGKGIEFKQFFRLMVPHDDILSLNNINDKIIDESIYSFNTFNLKLLIAMVLRELQKFGNNELKELSNEFKINPMEYEDTNQIDITSVDFNQNYIIEEEQYPAVPDYSIQSVKIYFPKGWNPSISRFIKSNSLTKQKESPIIIEKKETIELLLKLFNINFLKFVQYSHSGSPKCCSF
ncbi:hypothetical protein ACTA71_006209 [Dictyostelium dimigraforme]